MSRSYKHHPYYTDGRTPTPKRQKRFANKKVRHTKLLPLKGRGYKKVFCSYDIHDFCSYWSREEARLDYETDRWGIYKDEYPTLEDFYNHLWRKTHYNK